jgi:hypothetical protein
LPQGNEPIGHKKHALNPSSPHFRFLIKRSSEQIPYRNATASPRSTWAMLPQIPGCDNILNLN